MRLARTCLRAIGASLLAASTAAAASFFVDGRAGNDAADGLTWTTAKATVQAGLAAAEATPEPDVVSVAQGTYAAQLVVPPDVTLLGGFPTGGAPVAEWTRYKTVLDGAGAGPVVSLGPGTDDCVIDGFYVRGGATEDPDQGGGMTLRGTSARVRRCVIEGNRAVFGAGVHVDARGLGILPRVEDCYIRNNVITPIGPVGWDTYLESCGGSVFLRQDLGAPEVSVLDRCVLEVNSILDDWAFARHAAGIVAWGDVLIENVVLRANFGHSLFFAHGLAPRVRNVAFTVLPLPGELAAGLIDTGLMDVTPDYDFLHFHQVSLIGSQRLNWVDIEDPPNYYALDRNLDVRRVLTWSHEVALQFPIPVDRRTYHEEYCQFQWPGSNSSFPPSQDPLLVPGPLGRVYLSQLAAGQAEDSPALDAGGITVAEAGMEGLSTRTDGIPDTGNVDVGFHAWIAVGPGAATPTMVVTRGAEARALAERAVIDALPWTDAPGVLSDASRPLLFYSVDEATGWIGVAKDEATDSVSIGWR